MNPERHQALPLLEAFLSLDTSDQHKRNSFYSRLDGIEREITSHHGPYWGIETIEPLLKEAEKLKVLNHRLDKLQLTTVISSLTEIGYEIGQIEVLETFLPDIVRKLIEMDTFNPNQDHHEKAKGLGFVIRVLKTGIDLRQTPRTTPLERFINSLDLDDFGDSPPDSDQS